jgi:hypothetical protein
MDMKNLLFYPKFLIFLLFVSVYGYGQYTGSNPNVAALTTASSSDTLAGFEPDKAVDTLITGYCAIPGEAPAWLEIDLGGYYYIDGFGMVLPNSGELPTSVTVQRTYNNLFWSNLQNLTLDLPGPYHYDVNPQDSVRYVRFLITEKDPLASFTEVYVYGYEMAAPTPPFAYVATTITSAGFTASWSRRDVASGYRLSVFSDPDRTQYVPGYNNLNVGNTLSWNVSGLEPATTYYYGVRAYNILGTSNISNSVSATTLKAEQVITFDSLVAYIYGDAGFELSATATSGLEVTYDNTDETVAVISGLTVQIVGPGTTTITASQAGNETYLPAIPVSWDLVVLPKELEVTGAVAANKTYDGTADAAISGAEPVGVIGSDVVMLTKATTGTFEQTGVGTGIAVITDMGLAGADGDKYTLQQPLLVADITPKGLTVTGAEAQNKVYDGTDDALIMGGILEGIIEGDEVSITQPGAGVFAQKDVGAGLAVSANLQISGVQAGNYDVLQPSGLTADITLRDLTVTANDINRVACVPNPPLTVSYSGFASGENEGNLDSEPVATCVADENSVAGEYLIEVSGGSALNYFFIHVTGILNVLPDVTAPVLVVKNFTVQLGSNGTATITPADVVESATDNCEVADTVLSPSIFTTDNIGTVLVNVTALDAAGNSTTKTCMVTVEESTGIRRPEMAEVNIFPNPVKEMLTIENDFQTPLSVSIKSLNGMEIHTSEHPGGSVKIDLSNYPKGIYFLTIRSSEFNKTVKLIKHMPVPRQLMEKNPVNRGWVFFPFGFAIASLRGGWPFRVRCG